MALQDLPAQPVVPASLDPLVSLGLPEPREIKACRDRRDPRDFRDLEANLAGQDPLVSGAHLGHRAKTASMEKKVLQGLKETLALQDSLELVVLQDYPAAQVFPVLREPEV